MLEDAECEYEDKQYSSGEEWFGKDKPEILAKNPLANLPYVIDGENVVCQSNACFLYLGDKFGWNGSSPADKIMVVQLLDEIYDLRNDMIALVYPFKKYSRTEEEFKANAEEKLTKGCPGYYKKFEKVLEMNGKKYFMADTLTTPDFHIWEIIDQFEILAKKESKASPVADFPKLQAFYQAFKEEPKLQKYFASPAYKLDVNNKAMANAWFA